MVQGLPIVSIVVPFGGYLIGSLIYNWLNQKKELQWRLQVGLIGIMTSRFRVQSLGLIGIMAMWFVGFRD